MAEATAELKRTPLYAFHREHGGRMVPFAGYEMPVQYKGILAEHRQTRERASLFDVSHMGQIRILGEAREPWLETVLPADLAGLSEQKQTYTFLTNESGGILDDLMVANAGDYLFLVVNAACKEADLELLQAGKSGDVKVEPLFDRALLAIQGPAAAVVMATLAPRLETQSFMSAMAVEIEGVECWVSRSGYTGEDGYEISCEESKAEALARRLVAFEEVEPAGLGARDTLRLEAGLPLYGHDLDHTTSPVEAGLAWAISTRRRQEGGYPGHERIARELKDGPARRRVGLLPDGRMPVREGAVLQDGAGREVGVVTSGGFAPTVGAPVAMGYVASESAKAGEDLTASVRGKEIACRIGKLPFVPRRYYRG